MRRRFHPFAFTTLAALFLVCGPGLAFAGEGDEDEAMAMTGCLAETGDGGYVLQEKESGDEVALEGEGLGDHVGHTVKVTGEWAESDEGGEYFAVSSLEHLAASCES